jgi:hypothetical protein
MQVDPIRYSAAELARDIRQADDGDRLRLVFEFVERWNETPATDSVGLVASPPQPTGDRRWDALVAGLVEHLAGLRDVPTPPWVEEPARFFAGAWWVVDTPLFRVWALHDTPAALLRHGVMLSRDDLQRV